MHGGGGHLPLWGRSIEAPLCWSFFSPRLRLWSVKVHQRSQSYPESQHFNSCLLSFVTLWADRKLIDNVRINAAMLPEEELQQTDKERQQNAQQCLPWYCFLLWPPARKTYISVTEVLSTVQPIVRYNKSWHSIDSHYNSLLFSWFLTTLEVLWKVLVIAL